MDDFELKGVWWLPEFPEDELTGTLTFSASKGAYLELLGTFGEIFSNPDRAPKLIIGITKTGKQVTLSDCIPVNRLINFAGLGEEKYFAHRVFVGVHFESEDEIKFNRLLLRSTDLDSWINNYGFQLNFDLSTPGEYGASVEYRQPQNRHVQIDQSISIGVEFSSSGPAEKIIQTSVEITQHAYLCVKSEFEDLTFSDMYTMLSRLSSLHRLATQREPFPLELKGFTKKNMEILPNSKQDYYPAVEIYFQPVAKFRETKPLIPNEMLFTFDTLNDDQITEWFIGYSKYETQINLYRTLLQTQKPFVETRFLNISQALESVHSLLFESQYLPTAAFREKRDRALENIPDELIDWVSGALGNANYKRFSLKIFELLERKGALFSDVISDFENFSERVRDTRNEFVHLRSQKNSFTNKKELLNAIQLLAYLFEAYLLDCLLITEEHAGEIYKRRLDQYLTWATVF